MAKEKYLISRNIMIEKRGIEELIININFKRKQRIKANCGCLLFINSLFFMLLIALPSFPSLVIIIIFNFILLILLLKISSGSCIHKFTFNKTKNIFTKSTVIFNKLRSQDSYKLTDIVNIECFKCSVIFSNSYRLYLILIGDRKFKVMSTLKRDKIIAISSELSRFLDLKIAYSWYLSKTWGYSDSLNINPSDVIHKRFKDLFSIRNSLEGNSKVEEKSIEEKNQTNDSKIMPIINAEEAFEKIFEILIRSVNQIDEIWITIQDIKNIKQNIRNYIEYLLTLDNRSSKELSINQYLPYILSDEFNIELLPYFMKKKTRMIREKLKEVKKRRKEERN